MNMKMKQQLYRSELDVYEAGLKALPNKPTKDYISYLTLYINDELTTGTVSKPVSYAAQRAKLIKIMQQRYPNHGFRQTISKLDFDSTQFHELLFAMHFIKHEIEITNNIGYDMGELAPGIRRAQKIAYVEFKIVDPELQKLVSMQPTADARVDINTNGTTAEVKVIKTDVIIALSTGQKFLVKSLRSDGAPHAFIKYLIKNADNTIPKAVIQTEVEGCAAKKNMTEIVKQCGFTGDFLPFKGIFFTGTTVSKARITDSVKLDESQLELLIRIAKPIA